MNITEVVSFDKDGRVERFPIVRKLFLSLLILLVAGLSFGLGRLTAMGEREGIRIEYDPEISNSQLPISNQASVINASKTISVVGSSKGTKYHYLHCPGAKQISERNKITFSSAQVAEASGYTLATNCKAR